MIQLRSRPRFGAGKVAAAIIFCGAVSSNGVLKINLSNEQKSNLQLSNGQSERRFLRRSQIN